MPENAPNRKVVFYTNTPRAFRTTLIGHLYEISQVYHVILLSEDLDSSTLRLIEDKNLFPNIVKIISVHHHTGLQTNLISKNRYLCSLARRVILYYRPDIVIASSDWHSIFEMYLMRYSKKINALRITFQDTFNIGEMKYLRMWSNFHNAYNRMPKWLPLWVRLFFVNLRKYSGHILYYFVLPILNGEHPFYGKPSYILFQGHSGSRDSNYHVVWSERDYKIYRNSGVSHKKLYILTHPLTRQARAIFEKVLFSENKEKYKKSGKVVIVMLTAEEIGFNRRDYSLITKKERIKVQNEVFEILLKLLKGWKIIVKSHPLIENFVDKKRYIESISPCIEVADPTDPADKYIDLGDIVIDLPRAASTTLFSASLLCPNKPILALDLHKEFLGDCYKNFNGIEYIDSLDDFVSVLEKIRDNRYVKKVHNRERDYLNRFSDTIQLLEYFIEKKKHSYTGKE